MAIQDPVLKMLVRSLALSKDPMIQLCHSVHLCSCNIFFSGLPNHFFLFFLSEGRVQWTCKNNLAPLFRKIFMIPEMRLQYGIFGVHNQYFLSFLIFSVEFSVMVPDYIHEKVGNRDFRYIRKSLIMFKKGGNWLFSCTKLTLLTFHLICSLDFFWNCTWWQALKIG